MTDKKEIGTDITILERLGKGSYSSVHRCTDENGREMAVKCINTENGGIPNILEPSIMSTIDHPNVVKSIAILPQPDKLYILMERAVGDLREHSKRRDGKLVDINIVKTRAYSLAQAVACLHRQHIVHADVKSSNVLLYSDGNVRLSDFTVSVKHWTDNMLFTHLVGTATHRPLECITGEGWSYPFDIWSLGCTLYELTYGELLFPCQYDKGITQEQDNNRFINCLLDWNDRNSKDETDVKPIAEKFYPVHFPPEFNDEAYKPINKLILSMLRIDPKKRPTIIEILQDPFFHDLTIKKCMIIAAPSPVIASKDKSKIEQALSRYMTNPLAISIALQLYFRLTMIDLRPNIKVIGCALIACKLTLCALSGINIDYHILYDAERKISQALAFRLHTHI